MRYEVTTIQKETIWNELNLSGSKFKEWCLKPNEFVKNEKKEFPEFMREKIDFGNKLEDFIFETAKKSNNKYNFIKDKHTYRHNEYYFCYANVDGFFINKENEKGILEIKNTESTNIDKLVDNYKYQVLYYCWFFGLKNVMFSFLINGCRFRVVEFTFEDVDIEWAENKVLEFKTYLETNKLPKPAKMLISKQNQDSEIKQVLKDYDTKIDIYKDLKNEIENLELRIKEYCENSSEQLESQNYIFTVINSQRTTLDKAAIQEYAKVSNLDFSKFEKSTPYTTLKKTLKE